MPVSIRSHRTLHSHSLYYPFAVVCLLTLLSFCICYFRVDAAWLVGVSSDVVASFLWSSKLLDCTFDCFTSRSSSWRCDVDCVNWKCGKILGEDSIASLDIYHWFYCEFKWVRNIGARNFQNCVLGLVLAFEKKTEKIERHGWWTRDCSVQRLPHIVCDNFDFWYFHEHSCSASSPWATLRNTVISPRLSKYGSGLVSVFICLHPFSPLLKSWRHWTLKILNELGLGRISKKRQQNLMNKFKPPELNLTFLDRGQISIPSWVLDALREYRWSLLLKKRLTRTRGVLRM